jgi:DNA repair protein RadC
VEDADVERRSIDELIALVAGRAQGDLVARAGGLERLARTAPFELAEYVDPAGGARSVRALRSATALAAAFELGRRAESARAKPPEVFSGPADIAAWAMPRLVALAHEEVWVVGVDGRGRLRGARCIARGGLNGASTRVSDPLRAALRLDASAFVLVHNHPSGDPTPSAEDLAVTQAVAAAADVIGVPLLDHVVVAAEGFACVPFAAKPPSAARRRAANGSAR